MEILIFGYYIGQNYSSVQYKFYLDENEDIFSFVRNIENTEKVNNVPPEQIKIIIDDCSVMSDCVQVEKYRWELCLEY